MNAVVNPYRQLKESGVTWLGKIPTHWEVRRPKKLFRKMARPVRDFDEVVTCFRDGLVTLRKKRRLLGFTESLKEIGYQGIRRGDLVIHGMDAFAGAIGVSDSDGKATPVYSVCAPIDARANSHYYAHCVREMARSGWIVALAKGIRERSTDFRFDVFGAQSVPYPPSTEQTAIAHFLDHMDRRIQKYISAKEKLITLLDEYKQALIHQAVTGQIDVRTGEPYPEYKESGVEWIGRVPGHWDVVSLKWVSYRSQNGATPPTSEARHYEDGTVPWYGPSSCGDSDKVGRPIRLLNKYAFEKGAARLIRGTALLVVVIGATAGRMTLMSKDGSTNQQITAFELSSDLVNPVFLLYQIRLSETWLRSTASTATIPILDSNVVNRLPCAIPPIPEQTAIAQSLRHTAGRLDHAVASTRRQIDFIQEYRTRLIADVVTGKLDVLEASTGLPELDSFDDDAANSVLIQNQLDLDEQPAVA